jgi:16S rRNA (cytosine967-C5)-methyltransferase
MSRYYSYINSAKEIIAAYTGAEPFASHLKKRFAANKKFGSKDRRQITQLCYAYFRLGNALQELPVEERLLAGLFLCSATTSSILEALKPEWNDAVHESLQQKINLLAFAVDATAVFPLSDELSEGIDAAAFAYSHFQQPDLFLRIRPGKKAILLHQLQAAAVEPKLVGENCIALPNATKIEELIMLNKDAVVQDYSSQRVGELLKNLPSQNFQSKPCVWDCCAASGGKSIMAIDLLGNIDLTVSDVRESILRNLKSRFREAGINSYKSFVADLSNASFLTAHAAYDLIIADIPCSGSGTWGRAPEHLSFFNRSSIDTYSALQKKICLHSITRLKPGGCFLYITCSVFKKENEENVQWLQDELQLRLIKSEVLIGYTMRADTMFAALLQKQ